MDDAINIALICLLLGLGVVVTVAIITVYVEFFLD